MKKACKALVTGGAGFIGSHIVDELIARGIETYVIDNLTTGSIDNLATHERTNDGLLHIVIGDIADVDKLLRNVEGIDVVFHEAAIASVPRSVSHPIQVHDVNVNATLQLMNYCVKKGVRRMVFASSAAVYGIIHGCQASEEMPCKPNSPYGASKLAVENYLHSYMSTYGLEAVMLRYFNVYGLKQKNSNYSGVITIFVNKLLDNEIPTIYGDGSQVRDFVHVRDIVQANMLAMSSASAAGKVFNVASGTSTSILELLETIKSIVKEKTGIRSENLPRFAPVRPGDMKFGLASIEKIKTDLGYSPKVKLREGISEIIDKASAKRSEAVLRVRKEVP